MNTCMFKADEFTPFWIPGPSSNVLMVAIGPAHSISAKDLFAPIDDNEGAWRTTVDVAVVGNGATTKPPRPLELSGITPNPAPGICFSVDIAAFS